MEVDARRFTICLLLKHRTEFSCEGGGGRRGEGEGGRGLDNVLFVQL